MPDQVHALARWQDGRWSVDFRRELRPEAAQALVLHPGQRVQVACAVWNGAAGDSGARKSISIWQELVLDR
jgi:DMSO reductase family type II enzyme heme b subunit